MSTKQKTRMYIAGPMRGWKQYNFPTFDRARDYIRGNFGKLYLPVSPADRDRQITGFDPVANPNQKWQGSEPMSDVVMRYVHILCECGAIFMLPKWETSTGARAGHAVAEWLGLEIIEAKDVPPLYPTLLAHMERDSGCT